MSRRTKVEKRIQKQKEKLLNLQEKRAVLIKNEEEENQKLPQGKLKETKKDRKKKKKREENRKNLPDGKERKEADMAKVSEVQFSYARQNPMFYAQRKSLKEFLAPDTLDPNNYKYIKLQDAGRDVYLRNYYIDMPPKDAEFAITFSELYNFKNIMSQTRIEPITNERAVQIVDRQVLDLDTELATARKAADRNRYRKVSDKMRNAEAWGRDVESGKNQFFEVTFTYQGHATSLDELNASGNDLHAKALGKNISLVSCYGVEPEAYKSGFPLNRMFRSKLGPVRTMTAKPHLMDIYSLSTIFNHTKSNFYHKNGVYLGRDLLSSRPITFDPYDPSLEAHNIIFAGKTGTGKSATIKMFLSRAADFGLKYCSVDSEARGRQGEYSILTKKLGGENFQIHSGSKEIVNLFEVSEELEYDETNGQEVVRFYLVNRISIIKGILMTMITYGKTSPSFEDLTAMESIVEDIISYIYEIRGIQDGVPESLYASTAGYATVKKPLPTITDFYVEALRRQQANTYEHHVKGYALILDALKTYVRELYYIPQIIRVLSKEEYEKLPIDSSGHRYYETENKEHIRAVAIKGVRSYYDGQSTIKVNLDTPAINIDISQLPANDLPIGMVIATNFLNENIIKKNSANPKRLQKRAILIDEAHRMFPYPELRRFVSDLYRSARKRYIVPICCTQSLSDFKLYDETKEIVKQSPMIFLLRQDAQDREYIAESTHMSPGQLAHLFQLGGSTKNDGSVAQKGQVCMIINHHVVFAKIDYLKYTETDVVETNMQVIDQHIRERRSKEYAKKNR